MCRVRLPSDLRGYMKSSTLRRSNITREKVAMMEALSRYNRQHQDEDFYRNVSEKDVARQLEIVIGLIYLNEAKHCVAKETIKACFKKLLKQSGVFSEHEIEVLLL